jgi:hypothetical protein
VAGRMKTIRNTPVHNWRKIYKGLLSETLDKKN